MSKISLKPNASGTGVFSLEAPNSNTDRTLNLPDEAGTLATVENLPAGYTDSDALDLFNATGSAPVYACRAWVNFDGRSTISIRDSGNVSSITDDGEGRYTVNFSTAMTDGNYCAVGTNEGYVLQDPDFTGHLQLFTLTASSVKVQSTRNQTNGEGDVFWDSAEISVAVFR